MPTIDTSKFHHEGDLRVRRTILSIHNAFSELLQEQSADKITVSAISERAMINRKTFYLHYDSVDQLYDERLYIEMKELVGNIQKRCLQKEEEITIDTFFAVMSDELVELFEKHKATFRNTPHQVTLKHLEPILTAIILKDDPFGFSNKLGKYYKYFISFCTGGFLAGYSQWLDDSRTQSEEFTKILEAGLKGFIMGLAELPAFTNGLPE